MGRHAVLCLFGEISVQMMLTVVTRAQLGYGGLLSGNDTTRRKQSIRWRERERE